MNRNAIRIGYTIIVQKTKTNEYFYCTMTGGNFANK
jgi:hypothetical protein